MPNKLEKQSLKWLRQHASLGQRWITLATLCGSINAGLILLQAWLLATVLHGLIIEHVPLLQFNAHILGIVLLTPLRSLAVWGKEHAGFKAGATIRSALRQQMIKKLAALGPAYIQQQASGSWTTVLLEQIEKTNAYYSHYLVQTRLVMIIPIAVLLMVLPTNWASVVIFIVTAPLTIIFMILVGTGAADANKRNFLALSRLSGHFLDRLAGLATIRQFNRLEAEAEQMDRASDLFRQRTMAVLKMAFLSSAVLEFFASVSIAIIAVYFGFSYLGELNFGHYGYGVSLFSGLLVLFLAPEFFQPFRDLGTYYHAKAEAIGAADALQQFLQTPTPTAQFAATTDIAQHGAVTLVAKQLIATTTQGEPLTEAVSFTLEADQSLAISGVTGSGKTSILQVLMGALPYQGSVTLNGQELRTIAPQELLKQITWLGQNPMLFADTIAANLRLAAPEASDAQLWQALEQAYAKEFVEKLPAQLNYPLNDQGAGLSVGQAQRIALARALLKPAPLLLLDEPTASLDRNSEQLVQQALSQFIQGRTCILVSHRATQLAEAQQQLSLHTLQEV